jgi:hypothetical protein
MNRQISQLALLGLVLITSLIVSDYWQTWASAGLADKRTARSRSSRKLRSARKIRAANGQISRPAAVSTSEVTLLRRTRRAAYSSVVGY